MFKELKLKLAARRVQRKNARKKQNSRQRNARKSTSFIGRIWNVICWPFRMLARLFRSIWNWIRSIDLIGLVNLTLLVAIIVLFSLLIIDFFRYRKQPVVIVADVPVTRTVSPKPQITLTDERAPVELTRRTTLPIKRNPVTRKYERHPISVTENKCADRPMELYGDVIIDRRGECPTLSDGVRIHGNLYLQNMRKYILPCGARIEGNLFLRNVEMLQFCGEFTVTGNIYVSPRSSFGPIPRNARLGGQVIL